MFDDMSNSLLDLWANTTTAKLAEAVREIGLEAQEQMVHNLSGQDVDWTGGTFRINVRTGNLRRRTRLEYPNQGDPLSVLVFNDAVYAATIEQGISGEDKKAALLRNAKTSKAGRRYKTIPMPHGSLIPFWAVHEDSKLKDQPARPFAAATAEQMRERATDLLKDAIVATFRGDKP